MGVGISGVIFDMDGVLVDSEPFICKAACMMFAQRGLEVRPQDFEPFVGMGEDRYLGGVAESHGYEVDILEVKKRTYDIYLDIIQGALQPLPGVFEFIAACRAKGLKLAVASSADLRKVEGNLAQIGLPLDSFDAVVTGDDVQRKKPAPDVFLIAAARIGLSAADCLVIEDAVSGVLAAKAAGAQCLGITSSFSQEQLAAADFFARDLAEAHQAGLLGLASK